MGAVTGVDRRARTRAPTTSEAAWIAAIPTALLGGLAILFLGPPLGRALLAPEDALFLPYWMFTVMPEPVEQARYLIAAALPLLLSGLTVVAVRARWTAPGAGRLVVATQALLAALLAASWAGERGAFGSIVPDIEFAPPTDDMLPWPTMAVAAVATVAVIIATRRTRARELVARWTRESSARRIAAGAAAALAIAIWLLHAVETEGTIGLAHEEVRFNLYFTFDETYAVLDGRSPLVNFAAQYGSLWPYAFAGVMSLVGATLGVWIALALVTTGAGMLAIYAVLRRTARSALVGLALFLPILASSFVILNGTRQSRWTFANYFGTFPMRYAGPSILAWLLARHLDGVRPRRTWPLFLLAGLVVLNNIDVGVPALGATLAALLWAGGPLTRARAGRLALEAAAGLLAAFALVSLLTLARDGELPHLALLVRFARQFARAGFAMYPLPRIGLYVAIYLTYVAAIGYATVRAVRGDANRLLTGMLVWSGVLGLGTGAYYAGRSTPDDLPALFLPWSLTLALLLIPALGAIRDASWRRPPIAAVACVLGFFALAGSLAQTPTPWEQIERLQRTAQPIFAEPRGQQFIASNVERGESVVILNMLGHRIAANLGITNVSPWSNASAIVSYEQIYDAVDALRAAGGRKLFVDAAIIEQTFRQALIEAGFTAVAREATELWVDGG